MIAGISVYGFGSFFCSKTDYSDVDILIVHRLINESTCREAIKLKKSIIDKVEQAHITVLSKSAEQQFNFIATSQAVLLYHFVNKVEGQAFECLIKKIKEFRN